MKGVGGEADEKTKAAVHAYRRQKNTPLCAFKNTPLCVTANHSDKMSAIQTHTHGGGS